jgi:hypothetical protein
MTTTTKGLLIGRITGLVLSAALAACGSTSNIKPVQQADAVVAAPAQRHGARIDVSGYDRVVVLDFIDATDKSALSPDKARAHDEAMATAVRQFPDLIAHKLRESGAFSEVVRGPSPGKALAVSGRITRLVEGSDALRLWIGMGAGSSYFDATTELSDAESGQALGQVATDKNSWALGGFIAARQTVASFMEGAAQRIAAQLRDSKQGGAARKAN